jgi:uncharacterized cupin superfamily protein
MTSIIRINKDGSGPQGLAPCSVVPTEAVLSGQAIETGEFHYSTEDKAFSVGVWECTPYAEILNYPTENEYCVVLKGKVSLTNPDGSVETFEAGDSYVVPAGFKGKFEVHETLRKIYVIYAT